MAACLVDNPCVSRIRSDVRSPITTHGAMRLPAVILGMIDASAMRRFSIPPAEAEANYYNQLGTPADEAILP